MNKAKVVSTCWIVYLLGLLLIIYLAILQTVT